MKKCINCNDYVLYDDEINNCPVCGSRLQDYVIRVPRSNIKYATDSVQTNSVTPVTTRMPPNFEIVEGRKHTLNGMVNEVTCNARANNRLKKIVNVFFNGEPYQFGHTSHETVIRVEEIAKDRFATKKRDVYFYGDIEGRLFPGDQILVTAHEYRNRLVVQALRSIETETEIKPQGQISYKAAIALVTLLCVVVLLSISLVVWLFVSGRVIGVLATLFGGVLGIILYIISALAPLIVLFLIVRALLR